MSDMETVRRIVQTMKSLGAEVLDKAPAIRQEVSRLDSLLPKILVAGDQSVGKSALLNKLMPDCVQSAGVTLREGSGLCTLSITTIAFVRGDALSVTVTACGESHVWTKADGDATSWLAKKLETIQSDEAKTQKFFQFETSIVIKHPEISVDYALVDMPGFRPGKEGSEIEAEFEVQIKDTDLFLATDLAARDADTYPIILPSTLKKLKPGAKTIFVMTKADGITNPEELPAKFNKLEARGDIHKYALVCTKKDGDETSVLAEKTAAIEVTMKHVSGTAALRTVLEQFYRELMASKYPEALEAANGLMGELRTHIERIKPAMGEKSGAELITLSRTLVVEPACFADNSDLTVLAAKATQNCEQPYDRKWLERTFAEKAGEKGNELVRYVVDRTAVLRQGRVPGTEGLYNYLSTAYKIIGEEVLLNSCKQVLKEKFQDMKTETMKALQEKAKYNRQFKKIVEEYCKYVAALPSDPGPSLDRFLMEHEPTSQAPYPHNWSAKLILQELRSELARCRAEGASVDTLQLALQGPINNLEALSDNSEYIVLENVKNVILWYWEAVFSQMLIVKMKDIVGNFHTSIQTALDKCQVDMSATSASDPDAFKSPLDAADQKTLNVLKAALTSLDSVAGATPRATRKPSPLVNSANVANDEQPSSLVAGFRRLAFWSS